MFQNVTCKLLPVWQSLYLYFRYKKTARNLAGEATYVSMLQVVHVTFHSVYYTLCPPKNETRVILNIMYIGVSLLQIAMEFSM